MCVCVYIYMASCLPVTVDINGLIGKHSVPWKENTTTFQDVKKFILEKHPFLNNYETLNIFSLDCSIRNTMQTQLETKEGEFGDYLSKCIATLTKQKNESTTIEAFQETFQKNIQNVAVITKVVSKYDKIYITNASECKVLFHDLLLLLETEAKNSFNTETMKGTTEILLGNISTKKEKMTIIDDCNINNNTCSSQSCSYNNNNSGSSKKKSPPLEEKWKQILIRENELRLSDEVQQRFHEAENTGASDWMEVAGDVQKQVLIEFKMEPSEENLLTLTTKAHENPDISLYVKYNRARKGDLIVGSDAPNVSLVEMKCDNSTNTPTTLPYKNLLSYATSAGKPLVLICGSWS